MNDPTFKCEEKQSQNWTNIQSDKQVTNMNPLNDNVCN